MHLLSAAFLTLLTLTLTSPIIPARTCPTLSDFFITGFTTFTPAPSNTAGAASIFFHLYDSATNVSTSCARQLAPGSGRSIADPNHHYACNNPALRYLYDGKILVIKERFGCNGKPKTASGDSPLGTFCIPIEQPFPGGVGTKCEIPTGSANVFVTSVN